MLEHRPGSFSGAAHGERGLHVVRRTGLDAVPAGDGYVQEVAAAVGAALQRLDAGMRAVGGRA